MRWKWIPIVLVSIVIIIIVTAYIILSNYDYNKLKPHIERSAYEATGRELKLGGDIELKIGFTPSLVVENVSFQNAEWGSRPEAMSIRRFEVQVAILPLLRGIIEVKRFVLLEPDILIETDRSGRSNLEFNSPKKTALEVRDKDESYEDEFRVPSLEVGEVLLKNGLLTYNDGISAKSTSIKLKRLSAVATGMKSAVSIDLKGAFDETPFALSGKLDSLAELTDPAQGALNISALKISLAKNNINGSVNLNLSAARPLITARFASDSLDLRELLQTEKVVDEKKAGEKPVRIEKVFSSEPLPVDVLRSADLSLSFKTDSLITPMLSMKNLSIDLSLKNGHLKIAPLTGTIGGGKLDMSIEIRPKGKAVVLDAIVKVDRLDLATMGKELKLTELLNGTIDTEMKVSGTGDSVADIMGSLDGKKKIVMGRGQIDNKYFKFIGGDLSSNLLSLLNPLAEKEDYTIVNCMVVDFNIKEGLSRSSALVLDTSYMSVVGDGKINLKTEQLDISLKPEPKKGLGTEGLGKLTLSLGELARAFKLSGTLANPKLKVDKGQTALSLGKVLGGKATFGPTGIAAALAGTSKDEENPCLSAIEASKMSSTVPKPVEEKKGVLDKALGGTANELKDLGEGLQKLFGK